MAKWKFNAGHLQTSPNFRYDSFGFPIILELLLSPFRLLVGGRQGGPPRTLVSRESSKLHHGDL
jgi:hypothetical protein